MVAAASIEMTREETGDAMDRSEEPDDEAGDGYLNTIVSFTSKRVGYLAVVLIIGGCTLYFAAPYASEVFSYKSNIDDVGKVSADNAASLKTLWSEFSALKSQVAQGLLQQQFDEKKADEVSPADAVRDEQLREQTRRLDRLEAEVEQLRSARR